MLQAYFLFLIEFKLLCISVLLREQASHFSIHFFASSDGIYFWIITKNTTLFHTEAKWFISAPYRSPPFISL